MKKTLPEKIEDALRAISQEAASAGVILDAYAAAEQVLQQHPVETVTIEDVIGWIVQRHAGSGPVELSPPSLLIEMEFPASAEPEVAVEIAPLLVEFAASQEEIELSAS